MKIIKSSYKYPIFNTHKPIDFSYSVPFSCDTSDLLEPSGLLKNGQQCKLNILLVENKGFFLVKELIKILNFPSPHQFWKKMAKLYGKEFQSTWGKMTTIGQNEVLYENGLLNQRERAQKISYIAIEPVFGIYGTILVVGDHSFAFGHIDEYTFEKNDLTINQLFPQLMSEAVKMTSLTKEEKASFKDNRSVILPGQGFLNEININQFLKNNNYNKEGKTIGNINKFVKSLNDANLNHLSNSYINKINKLPLTKHKVIKPLHNNKMKYINGLNKYSPLILNHITEIPTVRMDFIEMTHNNLQFNKYLALFRNWRNMQWKKYYEIKGGSLEKYGVIEAEEVVENEYNLEVTKIIKIPNGNCLGWSNINRTRLPYE